MIVIVRKNIVGMPYIIDGPIVDWRGTPYVLKLFADPTGITITIFPI